MLDPILHHQRLAEDPGTVQRWVLALHGMYGAGRNWGRVMRDLVRERRELGAVLVDLREHGRSTGFAGGTGGQAASGTPGFAPPHDLQHCAEDVRRLLDHLQLSRVSILGHSFGGKVALMFARLWPGRLRELWIVDASPAARPPSGTAWEMLGMLREMPGRFDSRDQAADELQSRGVASHVASWMVSNLVRGEGGYRWRFHLDDMEQLLRDFFAQDLWDVVEAPPPGLRVHFVKAMRSQHIDPASCERIEQAGRATGRVRLHHVPGGHWVSAESAERMVRLLVEHRV